MQCTTLNTISLHPEEALSGKLHYRKKKKKEENFSSQAPRTTYISSN